MRGDPDSCGVWAPCLTYADGLFHLIYTDVKRYGRASGGGTANASLRDFHNYLVTAERIDGDWPEPTYLNSSGFDPSLCLGPGDGDPKDGLDAEGAKQAAIR